MNNDERRSDPAMDGARLQSMQPTHQPQLPLSPARAWTHYALHHSLTQMSLMAAR